MADNVTLNPGVGGETIATDDVSGVQHELVKVEFGVDGAATMVSASDPLPVTDALTSANQTNGSQKSQIVDAGGEAATVTGGKLDVNASIDTTGLATGSKQDTGNNSLASIDTKLTSPLTVTGTVSTGLNQPLTNTELRAVAVPVSGTLTVNALPAGNNNIGDVDIASIAAGDNNIGNVDIVTMPNVVVSTLPALAAGTNNIGDVDVLTLPALPSGTNNIGDVDVLTLPSLIAGSAIIGKVGIDQTTDGTTNKVRATATLKPSYGTTVVMTVTNLQSLASSATAGWQSARVSNISALATDFEIMVKLTTANTTPANDKAMYVFVCPFYTTDGGSTWFASSQGTTTLPTGSEGTTTIASPHNLRLLGVLNYTTQQMVVQDTFLLSNCFGNRMPDGFSIIIINYSGAALSTSCIVDYSPINDVLV